MEILDPMIKLQESLEYEKELRIKQYNYYRDKLLNFEGREDVEWKELGEVCGIERGIRITKKELLSYGYPVVSGGVSYMGYTDKYNRNENTITISQYGTAGYV